MTPPGKGWLRNRSIASVRALARARPLEPLLARCVCGFEARCERAASTLVRLPSGGWCCPECGNEPPALRVLTDREWAAFDRRSLELPESSRRVAS